MLTTTITIKYQGTPLDGADVIFGDYIERTKTTDSNGQISADFADNYAAVEWICILHSSFPAGALALGIAVIEAGKNYEYDIPEIETGRGVVGSNILREVP
jgi:hypothetical protein